jgi:hypothetical protein
MKQSLLSIEFNLSFVTHNARTFFPMNFPPIKSEENSLLLYFSLIKALKFHIRDFPDARVSEKVFSLDFPHSLIDDFSLVVKGARHYTPIKREFAALLSKIFFHQLEEKSKHN